MPNNCLKNLYFALVYPHLLYGVELYMNTCKIHYARLSVLNNKLLRILQCVPIETPIRKLYLSYNILQIHMLFRSQVLLLVYKFMFHKELNPPAYCDFFITNQQIHGHFTRSINNLHLDKFTKCIGQRCIRYQGSKEWNLLPRSFKVKQPVKKFKKDIYSYLMIWLLIAHVICINLGNLNRLFI